MCLLARVPSSPKHASVTSLQYKLFRDRPPLAFSPAFPLSINHPACEIALELASRQGLAEDDDSRWLMETVRVPYHHTVGDSAVMEVRMHTQRVIMLKVLAGVAPGTHARLCPSSFCCWSH